MRHIVTNIICLVYWGVLLLSRALLAILQDILGLLENEGEYMNVDFSGGIDPLGVGHDSGRERYYRFTIRETAGTGKVQFWEFLSTGGSDAALRQGKIYAFEAGWTGPGSVCSLEVRTSDGAWKKEENHA